MSKKSVFTCFILCIAIILSLAFSACGSTKVDNTTGPSGSTEDTDDATSASEPAETTSSVPPRPHLLKRQRRQHRRCGSLTLSAMFGISIRFFHIRM